MAGRIVAEHMLAWAHYTPHMLEQLAFQSQQKIFRINADEFSIALTLRRQESCRMGITPAHGAEQSVFNATRDYRQLRFY